MKISFPDLFRKIISKSWDSGVRKHTNIFFLCLGISVFIWLMIKMSGDYESSIQYSIKYTSIPEGKLLTQDADTTLRLDIRAKGFRIFSLKYLRSKPQIAISLEDYKIHKNRYRYGSYLLTSSLRNMINERLDIGNEITGIYPDTLNFILEKTIRKKVPVRQNITFSFKQQHQLYGSVSCSPDSVIISGPPSLIDTIRFVETSLVKLGELHEDANTRVSLINPDSRSLVRLSTDSCTLNVPVANYTEQKAEIPVQVLNAGGKRVKLFPEKIEITYLIALPDYNKVSNDMFEAVVDLHDITEYNKTLDIKLAHHPGFVKIIRIRPEKVEYIILK